MPRLLGIDLGSHSVKVTALRATGRQWVVEGRYDQRVEQEGGVPTLDARLSALDALFAVNSKLRPIASDVVALALPGDIATFHRISMPFSERSKVEQTLPFAVEAEVPFDLADMVLGWRAVSSGPQTQVLTALVRRDRLETWIGALDQRGLDPSVVYVDGEMLAPLAIGTDGRPAGGLVVAVVDVGHSHTTVSVVRGGQVEWTRSVNVGGWSFTRAIQQALSCSWAEAEARKHGRALPQDGDDALLDEPDDGSGYRTLPPAARQAMDGAIGLLLAEVRTTLVQSEDVLGVGVDEVRLIGGGARIPELRGYLQENLGVPVSLAGGEAPPLYALSNALAQHAAGQTGSSAIDLRIGSLAWRGRTDWLRAVLTYGVGGLAVFAVAAAAVFVFRYISLSRELAATDAEIREVITTSFPTLPATSFKDNSTAVALMAGETEDAIRRADVLTNEGPPPTVNAYYELTKAFPPADTVTVEVSELIISRDKISFVAETDGYASSAAVEESLRATEKFSQATKGDETKTGSGRVRFPITIPLGEAAAASGAGATSGEG
jgi:general secretion pathway protein L